MSFTPLNALNAFLAVARHSGFGAAARDLGVSTSALSQSVRQLETRLGVTLLTRTSRSVALTDAGRALLENAGPAVEQALESLKMVTARPGEIGGKVKLSVPASAGPLVLTTLVSRFARQHPKVEIDMVVDASFVDIVAAGFDAGIRLVESIHRDMVHLRLTGPQRFVVAGSPAYFKRKGVPEKPEDLLQHECLGRGREPYVWELARGKRSWRIPVRGPVTTNDAHLRHELACAGVGLIYTLESLVARDVARRRLRIVLDAYGPRVPGLFLYFPDRASVSPAFRAFLDVARELARESLP